MPRTNAARLLLLGILLAPSLGACGERTVAESTGVSRVEASEPPERLVARIVATHPHDERSYTQGLLWWKGRIYESRGRRGESGVHSYTLGSNERLDDHELERDLFGEGLTVVHDTLVQVTWQSGVAIVYDESLSELRRARFRGEGWGLTYDGNSLILTDSSHVLKFLDPETFEVRRRLPVLQNGSPRDRLNELEWVDGVVWANVYETDEIVRIDPESGQVTAVVDASGLLDRARARRAEVLNGIAFLPERDTFLITGKYWPLSFEVTFEPAD